MIKINVELVNGGILPQKAHLWDACFDLHARLEESVTIHPGMSKLIPCGFIIELPIGYKACINPRSGLALKNCVTVLNSPGQIDSTYRGEVCAVIINHSLNDSFTVYNGDRIAQMSIDLVEMVAFNTVDKVSKGTDRGWKGFGSTGTSKNMPSDNSGIL